jgi:dTDP-4-dehydrorhamnose reductase
MQKKVSIKYTRKPKVFILGLSGNVGYQLALHLREKFTVVGAYFQHEVNIPNVHAFPVSLKNLQMLEALLGVQRPDYCIMATGILDKDFIESNPKGAENINVLLPLTFAVTAQRLKARTLHLSCSEVFDGITGSFTEDDRSFSMEPFGKSKVTAETYIRAQTMEANIIRFGPLLGLGHSYRPNILDRARIALTSNKALPATPNVIHSYLSYKNLCLGIEQILLAPFPNAKHRTFHFGGVDMSEAECFGMLVELFGGNPDYLKLEEETRRKARFTLDCTATEKALGWKREDKTLLLENLRYELRPGLNHPYDPPVTAAVKAAEKNGKTTKPKAQKSP